MRSAASALWLVLAACDPPSLPVAPVTSAARPAPASPAETTGPAAEVAALPMPAPLPASQPPPPANATEAIAAARAELELVDASRAAGTSKLYSRSDFLAVDDPRGMSAGDFVGRLRALFGEVANDSYVLRHRATGLVITAYAAQSGPSYGGVDPPEGAEARNARRAALRSVPHPRETHPKPVGEMNAAELLAYRKTEHAHRRAVMDARAHPDVARAIVRLDALVSAVPPVDWRVTRYWGEDPTVYVEGVENGEAFSDAMAPVDGLAYLLERAERGTGGLHDASQGTHEADLQLVAYWGYHMKLLQSASARPQLERARARVQRAWFRLVEGAHRRDAATREHLLALAEIHAPPLRLDPARAAAALKGPAPR